MDMKAFVNELDGVFLGESSSAEWEKIGSGGKQDTRCKMQDSGCMIEDFLSHFPAFPASPREYSLSPAGTR